MSKSKRASLERRTFSRSRYLSCPPASALFGAGRRSPSSSFGKGYTTSQLRSDYRKLLNRNGIRRRLLSAAALIAIASATRDFDADVFYSRTMGHRASRHNRSAGKNRRDGRLCPSRQSVSQLATTRASEPNRLSFATSITLCASRSTPYPTALVAVRRDAYD
ncbi:MAG: hypothetical protein MZU97_21505 [Bacillus subtilis]|nr:hypothetical protein [Bacillus subtilis]